MAWQSLVDSSASPPEVDPKHTCEEPSGSPSASNLGQQHHDIRCKHCGAVASVSGERHDRRSCTQCFITDMFQVQSWVQVVGTSGSVRAERNPDVTQVVRRWRWGDKSVLDTTEINLAHSTHLPKLAPCPCNQVSLLLYGWTAKPFTSTDESARHLALPSWKPSLSTLLPRARRDELNLTSLLPSDQASPSLSHNGLFGQTIFHSFPKPGLEIHLRLFLLPQLCARREAHTS